MVDTSCTIGVDLGGTKLDVGLVDSSGKIVDRLLVKTKVKEGAEAVIQDIINAVEELRNKHPKANVLSVGLGIAGQIDKLTGSVRFAPNLNWHDVPLQTMLHRALKLPVYITNDVRAATWGEWLFGAGKGSNDILCVFVGTGIGGGVVSDGKMLVGFNNSAGEIGHITIDTKGPQCTCGNYGCFEALAGGWAIARRVKLAVQKDPKGGKPLLECVKGKADELSAKSLFQLARLNDPLAKSIVEEISNDLIAGIAGLANAFNPEILIIGGGIINGYPEFLEAIRVGIPKKALKSAVESLKIVEASLHADAGVAGAAAFARNAFKHGEINEKS